jgi:hypothetical protein
MKHFIEGAGVALATFVIAASIVVSTSMLAGFWLGLAFWTAKNFFEFLS